MGKAKLSPEDKLAIRTRHDGGKGESIRKLAKEYKVNRGTIRYTVNQEYAEGIRERARIQQQKAREQVNGNN